MFLFTREDDNPPLDIGAVRSAFRRYGPTRELRHRRCRLLWIEDEFVFIFNNRDRIRVECRRPGVDATAICSLEWFFDANRLIVRRRWSGEFCAYYWREPFIIASHLRIASVALGLRRIPGARRLRAGFCLRVNIQSATANHPSLVRETRLNAPFLLSRAETVSLVRRLVTRSVSACPSPMALLLSGGIDSSVLAAAAVSGGQRVQAFVFSVTPRVRRLSLAEDDLRNARLAAAHLGVPLRVVHLKPLALIKRVPIAVRLAETARGTIIDECGAPAFERSVSVRLRMIFLGGSSLR
jgi:hypothetical protein